MSIEILVDSLHSNSLPTSRNYLVINELLKIYSKFTEVNLINLYNLNEIYNTFGWYYDKKKKQNYFKFI